MILGNGGAAKAVKYVLDKHNIHHKRFPEALKSTLKILKKPLRSIKSLFNVLR
jgi:shikimate 5-dehydrogenase